MLQRIPVLPASTPDSVSHALKAHAQTLGVQLTARPYNPFDAGQTTWWLVPSPEFPAHRFGKYSVRWAETDDRAILLGVEVEKGVGPSAAPAFRSAKGRRLVMSEDWKWAGFVADVRAGDFPRALGLAARKVDAQVHIRVTLGMINDPDSFDPDSPALPRSHWVFLWNAEDESIKLDSSRGDTSLAPAMAKSKTLSDVIDHIENAENVDWLWGKTVACVTLQPNASEIAPVPERDIWKNYMSLLRRWV